MMAMPWLVASLFLAMAASGAVLAGDWPQFMRVPEHTGDASDEILKLPLQLATQVKLEDAVLASPAVVAGRVYVVDQMGTAYCIDPRANTVVWKSAPDGDRAMGGNTSSPSVAEGRLCYATTAGKVHVLDVRDGKLLASVEVGPPVTGSLTWANKSLHFQTLGAKVFRMDLSGKVLWEYDHYAAYKENRPDDKGTHATTLAMNTPMYGGGEVAVSGDRVVVNLGWDLFCLRDQGSQAELLRCRRNPLHKHQRGSAISGQGVYAGPAICGEWVYAGFPGCELIGDALRLRLSDGFIDPARKSEHVLVEGWRQHWAALSTVAVRGTTVFAQSHHAGMVAFEFGKVLWENRSQSCDNRTVLAAADGRVYLPRFQSPLVCLSAKDGSLLWTRKAWSSCRAPSIAPCLLATRSYGGGEGVALSPETGENLRRGQDVIRTGGPEHTCGPVVLTSSDLSLAVTVSGLHVRSLGPDNEIVWSSLGFAPRACANAIVASGRVFCNPQNGMLYCFEPVQQ